VTDRSRKTDTLTRQEIVDAAIELLDHEGLEGFNMRALGKRLGSAATAVYWHLGSKDNLVAVAGDQVWNEIALPDLTRVDWRTAARAIATDLRAMLARHPWMVQAFGSFVVFGPGKARYDDHSLAIYEAAGFTGIRVQQAATAVFTFVLGNALGGAVVAALGRRLTRGGPTAKKAMAERMVRAREAATEFPRLRSRLDTGAAEYGAAPARSFELGLDAMLDGLQRKLATKSRQGPPKRRTRGE
jgi:AcrR family transcriptional regulator